MLYQVLSNPFLTAILACLAPTIAFAGVNARNFSSKQIFFASLMSLTVGGILGGIISFIPPLFGAVLVCLAFFLFSEQLLSSIFPVLKHKGVFYALFLCFVLSSTYWWSLLSFNIVLIVYFIFSLKDLYTNIQTPKENIFDAKDFSVENVEETSLNCSFNLNTKPDIFLLFLESMHGREALAALYNMDDEPLYQHLEVNKFIIHTNSFSNAQATVQSLNNIFNMNNIQTFDKENMPAAINILLSNGYETQFFDSNPYAFQAYIKYAKFFNLDFPKYVKKMYDWMLPFFLQSKYLMYITKGMDPFSMYVSNELILKTLITQLNKKETKPQCYIVRIGAQHVPMNYNCHSQRLEWLYTYREMYYTPASLSLRETIDEILLHRPEALIIATGDHGPRCLSNAWQGFKADPHENMREYGISPTAVTLSYANILLAIRWPKGERGINHVLSPCNIFHSIFTYLGKEGQILQAAENLTCIPLSQYATAIVVREGQMLDPWEWEDCRSAQSGNELAHLSAEFFLGQGRFEDALEMAEKLHIKTPDNPVTALQLLTVLECMGNAIKIEILCKDFMSRKDPVVRAFRLNFLRFYFSSMVLQGKINHLREIPKIPMLNEIRRLFIILKKTKVEMLTDCKEELKNLPAIPADITAHQKRHGLVTSLALCLREVGQAHQAIEIIEQELNTKYLSASSKNYYLLDALLTLSICDWEESERKICLLIEQTPSPCPHFFFLLLMGVLEQQGKIDQALQLYEKEKESLHAIPKFSIQIGLFAIRNMLFGKDFSESKKEAYKYLRHEKIKFINLNLFNEEWYAAKYTTILSGKDPIMHYLHYRHMLVLDPNPIFDSIFYYILNEDVVRLSWDPIRHFLHCSSFENRNPSLYFSVLSYMAKHPETAQSGVNTLVHHLQPKYRNWAKKKLETKKNESKELV